MNTLDRTGRKRMVVSANTAAVISGEDDLSTWTDEELLKGQRRSKRGTWEGKPPTVVPMRVHQELIRRRIVECEAIIRESCVHAARYLDTIVRGVEEPKSGRMRAAEVMLERFLGKPTERHLVNAKVEITDAPWVEALRKAARSGSIDTTASPAAPNVLHDDVVDAEVIETNPLCACGCGQPPRPGSLYFNAKHEQHAMTKVAVAAAVPTPPIPEDDPILTDDDPILEDDDEFIEEDDDPILED